MENYKNSHEEIFIVGSRYGELLDAIRDRVIAEGIPCTASY
jgi:hypothetical protein